MVEAFYTAEKQTTVPIEKSGAKVELVGLQAIFISKIPACACCGIQPRQAAGAANPEFVVGIMLHQVGDIAYQAVLAVKHLILPAIRGE